MTTNSHLTTNNQPKTHASSQPADRKTRGISSLWLGLAGLVLLLGMFSAAASAQCSGINLVTNGGFETGSFSGWTVAWTSDTHTYVSAPGNSGSYAAFLGAVPGENRLSQKITTTAGKLYTVCFSLSNSSSCCASSFHARWNGYDLITMVNPGGFGVTQYSFEVFGTGSDVLSFEARQVPSYFHLDDIKVTLGGYSFAPSLEQIDSKDMQ